MKNKSLQFALIVVVFLVSCILSWRLYFKVYSQEDKVNIHVFPKEIGEWKSKELIITEHEYAILETKNAFSRKYFTESGKEVSIFIVYSENNRKVSHPPEVCYTGGGITILDKTIDSFTTKDNEVVRVNNLLMEKGFTQLITFYWFKVGSSFTPSYWKQQILIGFKTLLGESSSSALIRLSAVVRNEDDEKAINDLKDFSEIAMPHIVKHLP